MGFITVSKDMKAQNNKPVMFTDTEAGNNMLAVKVNISGTESGRAQSLPTLHFTAKKLRFTFR